MNSSSTPHGSNGGGDPPPERLRVAYMRAETKKILMAALSRTDQVNNLKDLTDLVAEINSDVTILRQKFSPTKSEES